MKKWRGQLKQWVVNYFNLPEDVLLDLPRITTIGQIHAYIENHHGLVTFSENEILLRMKQGYVRVKGENFVLKTMLQEEIIVEGKIREVQYLEDS
ncbi:sporulation protein YqfC [Salinibacillus kushneri]|uniref:Sporulation protein YqfC n=1 Tax=Salinibacillus kushneri TaxID=237682 RepID=A0A1I0FZS2_9BACI|nr:sporulation protein YqfC [Salinibacillus kushneri]SET63903.1 sporulation protein YqfC [Salinibacillus kushneri]